MDQFFKSPDFAALVLYMALAVGMGVTIIGLVRLITWWRGKYHGEIQHKQGKGKPYECGVPQLASSRERLSIKFYLVALFFVLFDIETVFLLPYAVSYRQLGLEAFYGVVVFIAILGLGLLYIVKRRALEWD